LDLHDALYYLHLRHDAAKLLAADGARGISNGAMTAQTCGRQDVYTMLGPPAQLSNEEYRVWPEGAASQRKTGPD
jgi:hypothetical protein